MSLVWSLNNFHESEKSLFMSFNEGEFEPRVNPTVKPGDGTSDMKTM